MNLLLVSFGILPLKTQAAGSHPPENSHCSPIRSDLRLALISSFLCLLGGVYGLPIDTLAGCGISIDL